MPNAFLDTNVILYAAAAQKNDPEKASIARSLIGTAEFCLSFQVLQEFYVNATKPSVGLSNEEVDAWIERLLLFDCCPGDEQLFLDAILYSRRFQISYWDGAIVAAAKRLGATTLYTEDLNHGQNYDGLTAINPFLEG